MVNFRERFIVMGYVTEQLTQDLTSFVKLHLWLVVEVTYRRAKGTLIIIINYGTFDQCIGLGYGILLFVRSKGVM